MVGSRRASMVLPAPGGPDHQHVMGAGGGDLEGALGMRLPAHLREVDARRRGLGGRSSGSRTQGGAARSPLRYSTASWSEASGDRVHARHRRALRGIAGGQQEARDGRLPAVQGHRQGAAHRPDTAVERELAHHARERSSSDGLTARWRRGCRAPSGRSKAGPSLRIVGGRQAHRDPLDGELEARSCGWRRGCGRGSRGRWSRGGPRWRSWGAR